MTAAITDVRTALFDRMSIGGLDACWWWKGNVNRRGYGSIKVKGKMHLAHRFVYEYLRGPIPEGHLLHHRCEEPLCVNPRHLEPMTHREHQVAHDFKGVKIRADNLRAETHCSSGHEYTEENTYWTKNGWRRCNECRRIGQRRRYHESKAPLVTIEFTEPPWGEKDGIFQWPQKDELVRAARIARRPGAGQ